MLFESALWYAEHGIPIFPCKPRGKVPMTTNGFHAATTDAARIRTWWTATPNANIGIPTGPPSGLLLLDVDPRHGGQESLDALLAKYGRWPRTAEAITGGGGRHIYFRHVDGLQCSAGAIGAGIDIRTIGGYVIAAPSVHPSGGVYDWDGTDGANSLLNLADPPGWLIGLAKKSRNLRKSATGAGAKIPQGRRNEQLASLGGAMRSRGFDAEEINAALQAANSRRCDPPLAEAEVRQIAESVARYDAKAKSSDPAAERQFEPLADGRYVLRVPGIGAEVEVDRLRREHQQLVGELAVRCSLPGALTYDGAVSIADFNLSSATARKTRANLISERVQAPEIDWGLLLEEFVQRVLSAERAGLPAVRLRDLPRPTPDDMLQVEGLAFPRRHPSILFGDGGAAKSYIAIYIAGRLAQRGLSVAIFDWELAGDDHRERFERLFGFDMPAEVFYLRCERPLVQETDRLRRVIRDNETDFAIFDSVAVACDGPPEAAEVAGRYFRSVRELGIGSLHVAHIAKGGEGSDQKPFGSTFWHNLARCTWFAKRTDPTAEGDTFTLGLFPRKNNLAALGRPLGFKVAFTEDRTTFTRTDVADTDLAAQMTIRQRMAHVLRHGSLTAAEVAQEIDAEADTVKRTARRYKDQFVVLDGGRLGLTRRTA